MQFYEPHTGMVYTPPQFSDHIGVSHVLRLVADTKADLGADAATRKAQPHSQQKSIKSFFTKAPAGTLPAMPPVLEAAAAGRAVGSAGKPVSAKRRASDDAKKTAAADKKRKLNGQGISKFFQRESK